MKTVTLYISILLLLVTISCSNKNNTSEEPVIVTTTGMIGDAVKNIVNDKAKVISLMGPGVDPHLYKATQGDLGRLNSADVIYYNGLYLEGKMAEVLEKLARIKPVVAVAEQLEKNRIRQDTTFQGAFDPHVWFDISLWRDVVLVINEDLKQRYPEMKEVFENNTLQYVKKLDSLDTVVKEAIMTIPENKRVLITSHDAFGYFGDAYNIQVKGLQGISTATEFGLKDITELVDFIIDRKVNAVFVETSVSQKAIKAVVEGCNEQGWDVVIGGTLYGDAMGEAGTPEGTYIGMVDSNVRTIVESLTKEDAL